ncbi:MAG: hypothetical protein WA957_16920, partial [Alteraurantiacibacter sp.]
MPLRSEEVGGWVTCEQLGNTGTSCKARDKVWNPILSERLAGSPHCSSNQAPTIWIRRPLMKKAILAAATALSMAAIPAAAQVNSVDDKRDMTEAQQMMYD